MTPILIPQHKIHHTICPGSLPHYNIAEGYLLPDTRPYHGEEGKCWIEFMSDIYKPMVGSKNTGYVDTIESNYANFKQIHANINYIQHTASAATKEEKEAVMIPPQTLDRIAKHIFFGNTPDPLDNSQGLHYKPLEELKCKGCKVLLCFERNIIFANCLLCSTLDVSKGGLSGCPAGCILCAPCLLTTQTSPTTSPPDTTDVQLITVKCAGCGQMRRLWAKRTP